MNTTGVAYKDCLLLNCVSALAVARTRIDGMLVVEASADCVAFDNLVTHFVERDLVKADLGKLGGQGEVDN